MSSEKRQIKVYLCHDHFERVLSGAVCDTCPSKYEHREAVMSLAAINEKEDADVHAALLTEIRTLRTSQQSMYKQIEKLSKAVLGDGNGDAGLRSRVMILEHDATQAKSSVANWIATAACVVALGSMIVSMIK